MRSTLLFAAALLICAMTDRGWTADAGTHEAAIRSAFDRSSLVITGKFGASAAGGRGATSQVEVVEVYKALAGFKAPERVTVFWLTNKRVGLEAIQPSPVILLLTPAADAPSGYTDATTKDHPFVPATEANLRLVRTLLKTMP